MEETFSAYGIIMVNDSFEEQINLKDENNKFIDFIKNQDKWEAKTLAHENVKQLLQRRQNILNGFETKKFPRIKTNPRDMTHFENSYHC